MADGGAVWTPSPEYSENSTLAAFLRAHRLDGYDALVRRADGDPEWLWNAVIEGAPIRFYTPPDRVMDTAKGQAWTEWCAGGTTNIVLNCLDAHDDDDREAISWEGEDGTRRSWSLGELKAETARLTRRPSVQRMNNVIRRPDRAVREWNLGFFPNAGGLPIWAGEQIIGFIGVGGMAARPPEWSDEICAHRAMEEVIGAQPTLTEIATP